MKEIVIAQRGWVFVGDVSEAGDQIVIENASCIRKWGTTKGLGELVNGPTPNTVLDPVGHVQMHQLTVIARIKAGGELW